MNKIIFVILISVIGYLGFCNYLNNKKIDKLTIENSQLSEDLKMKTVVYKDKVIYQVRENEKTKTVIKYLPPESSATITTDNQDQTTLNIKTKGFCLFPAVNSIASNTFHFGLGARLFFFDRYGLGVGISNELKPYLYIDRRISDFIPFCQNTAVGISYDGNIGLIISIFL